MQSRFQGHQRNRLQTLANRVPERQCFQLHHDRQNGHRNNSTPPRSHVAARLAPRRLATTHRTPTPRSRRLIPSASSRGSSGVKWGEGSLSCSAVSLFHERPNINKGGHGGATVDPGGAAKAHVASPRHGHGEKGCTGPFSMPEESEAVMECTFPPCPHFSASQVRTGAPVLVRGPVRRCRWSATTLDVGDRGVLGLPGGL